MHTTFLFFSFCKSNTLTFFFSIWKKTVRNGMCSDRMFSRFPPIYFRYVLNVDSLQMKDIWYRTSHVIYWRRYTEIHCLMFTIFRLLCTIASVHSTQQRFVSVRWEIYLYGYKSLYIFSQRGITQKGIGSQLFPFRKIKELSQPRKQKTS